MTDTASAAPSLLPCPFCGNANAIMYDDLLTFHVDCLSCGATGGASSYRNGAIDAWNTRTQPTQPAVVEPMTDGLLQQHNRDSQELRRLCAARDQARSERDALKAEIAGLESSCSTLGRLVDELRADSERLEWVLRRCAGSWLRSYLGVVSDTGDMDTLRMLIDANRGALAAHGIKKENGNG